MTKNVVRPTSGYQNALDVMYNNIPDPSNHAWTKSELLALVGYVTQKQQAAGTYIDLTACVLLSITDAHRTEFLAQYDVHYLVLEKMEEMGAPVWPETIPATPFDEISAESLEAYQTTKASDLKVKIDMIGNQVIDPSPRAVLVSSWLSTEALRYQNNLYDTSSPTVAQFPGLEGFMARNSLTDIAEAASEVLARGTAWAAADAQLQAAMYTGIGGIKAATTIEDVDTAYAGTLATIEVIAQALASA